MSETTEGSLALAAAQRPPLYRDATIIKWVIQVVTLMVVVAALWFLVSQAGDNLKAKDIDTGFDFLNINPGIKLSEGIDTAPDTGGRALWTGMVNTLRVSIAGIICATLLGIVVGIARLSNNWLVSKMASVFIEYMRNIPLLVHMVLFFSIIATFSDLTKDIGPINGWLHISNKGTSIPRLHIDDGFYQWLIFMIIGYFVARFVRKKRQALQDETGRPGHMAAAFWGTMALFVIVGWFLNPIFGWVGSIFSAIAALIDALPKLALQGLLSLIAIGAAFLWIKRFLDSRRTPAGLAKLTDDDYFRMIFAGVAGLFGICLVWLLWPGMASWMLHSGHDFFEVLADKFGGDRSNQVFGLGRPDTSQTGKFVNVGRSGLNFSQGLAALFFALVFYTGAFVAEIVRGGILAVPKGQTEAAQAIGLKRTTMLSKIILPQAFRVSLPPLGNQYLNLTKNTSLALAVGYSDLVQVGTTIFNQTGKSIEVFIIWMGFYLACSLTISVIVNFFNIRLKIVER